jgi:hypothetical protein
LLLVSAAHANGVVWRTRYPATVRIGLAILVTLVACKNPDVERLNDVKRAVCACKDATCADQAMAKLEKTSIAKSPKTRAVAKEIFDCRSKLELDERPSTDPDTEGPPAGSDTPAATGSAAAPAAGSAAAPAAGSAAPPAKP